MTVVTAGFLVQDGIVWSKNYFVDVAVPPESGADAPFGGYGYTLMGSAEGASRFNSYIPAPMNHPFYQIGKPDGCTGCIAVWARFTPYSDPTEVNRLMDFNLECITRWHPCRNRGDLMPSVWKQYLEEDVVRSDSRKARQNCTFPLQWIARDADNVATVEVMSSRVENGTYPFQVSTVRLIERLKAATFWNIGTTREVRVFSGTVSGSRKNAPNDVSPGSKFLMMFEHRREADPHSPEVWPTPCGLAPLNTASREAVVLGVQEDFAAPLRQVD